MDFVGNIDIDDLTDDEEFLQLVAHSLMSTKVFRARQNHLLQWSNQEFFDRFRLSKSTVQVVLDLIRPSVSNITGRNHAVSPELMLLTTLRFYATGSFLNVCGDFSGLHKSTVSRIVRKVSRVIASLKPQFIYMPRNEDEERKIRRKMFSLSSFPKCVGAVDCTHIKLLSPGGHESEIFRNRKGFFSLNVQTVSDADLKIQNIVARWPGSTHDATIFRSCSLKTRFESGQIADGVLVGDRGYPLKRYLLTPLANPTTRAEQLYNESLIRTRNVVERSYVVWKRRFPVLAQGLRVKLETVEAIVVATAVLHNIACDNNEMVPEADEETAFDIQQQQFPNNVEALNENETAARQSFINYFENLIPEL